MNKSGSNNNNNNNNNKNNNNDNNNNNLKKILISVRNYCDLGFFISHSLVLVIPTLKL